MTPCSIVRSWLFACLCLLVASQAFADTRDIKSRWVSAISADNVTALRALLDEADESAELNVDRESDEYSDTKSELDPLWKLTASNGKSALMVACKVGDVDLAERLVELGANIKDRTITNGTAFMFAVLGDQTGMAQWLAGLGANINAQGSNGWTGVMIASAKGLDTTLSWLLSEDANAQLPDVYGFSPLMRASDNGHTEAVRLLLSVGKDPSHDVAQAVDVHWQDELENTALHYAVAGNQFEIVQLLLEANARVKTKNRAGLSALDIALGFQNKAVVASGNQSLKERQEKILEALLRFEKSG